MITCDNMDDASKVTQEEDDMEWYDLGHGDIKDIVESFLNSLLDTATSLTPVEQKVINDLIEAC